MRVTGLVPPIVTPFFEGRLDLESLQRLIGEIGPFVSGFLVGGSVGEHPSLAFDERVALLQVVARSKQAEHTLAANVSDNCIGTCIDLAEAAERAGANLLVVSAPNYYANTLPMVAAFLRALAQHTALELCLYDNPLASHTTFSRADLVALASMVPSLTHVKVTDLAPDKVTWLLEDTGLTVLAGDDAVIWRMLVRGAHGAMVALPMIYPRESHELWAAMQDGRQDDAARMYRSCANFLHVALGAADYVQVIKAVLHARGSIRSPETRVPLLPLDELRCAEVIASL